MMCSRQNISEVEREKVKNVGDDIRGNRHPDL